MEFSHGLAQWDFESPKPVSTTVAHPRTFITDKWFLKPLETTPALQITRLLYIVNYFYSVKQYDDCLQYIQQGLDLNYSKKKEFLEIKARVLKRLKRLDEALEICNLINKNDPSITFLKAQLHSQLYNYIESFNCFLDYLLIRTDDFSVWVEMSRMCNEISNNYKDLYSISSKDWNKLSNIMYWISDLLYNRTNSTSGELYEISKSKRISNVSFSDMTKEEVESAISLLKEKLENLGKVMHNSCLQLSIIEVG